MMKPDFKFTTVLALVAGLALHGTGYGASEVIDWNNITYGPTAAQAQTKTALTDTALTDNTLSIQYTLNGGATFSGNATSPNSASNNDNTTYYATSGVATQRSLQTIVDFASNTQSVTETLFFAQPVSNVTFKIFDVDAGTVGGGGYLDVISSIQGVAFQNSTVYASTVTGSMDNTVTGSGATFQASGTANNAQTANLGDITVTFGNIPLTQISFVYGDNYTAGTHSTVQLTALGNLTVITVPEPGTLALVGLGIAGATVMARRRR